MRVRERVRERERDRISEIWRKMREICIYKEGGGRWLRNDIFLTTFCHFLMLSPLSLSLSLSPTHPHTHTLFLSLSFSLHHAHDNFIISTSLIFNKLPLKKNLYNQSIGIYHPLDGVTNPKYRLLSFLTTNIFLQR